MRRVGLIGGIGWGATAEYYRRMNLETRHRLGGHHSAEITIQSLDLHPLLERAHDVAALEGIFDDAASALQAAGARLLAVASLTGHRYVGRLRTRTLPFVDLIDSIAAHLQPAERSPLAVWATSIALADPVLMARLSGAVGAQLVLPSEEERSRLDHIIFSELADQAITPPSLEYLRGLLAGQRARGARALLLATTDFSVIRTQLGTELPIFDATEIHCRALLDAALA